LICTYERRITYKARCGRGGGGLTASTAVAHGREGEGARRFLLLVLAAGRQERPGGRGMVRERRAVQVRRGEESDAADERCGRGQGYQEKKSPKKTLKRSFYILVPIITFSPKKSHMFGLLGTFIDFF
jgi:hypothetical protein